MEHFPEGWTPRSEQQRLLEELEAAIRSGTPYLFVEAPPGVGKSAIGFTVAKWMWATGDMRTYITTATKILQGQYLQDFRSHGLRSYMGRSNFPCRASKGGTCEDGFEMSVGGKKANQYCQPVCPYLVAREEAVNSRFTIMNYASLWYGMLSDAFVPRELLVLDEGHSSESQLMLQVEVGMSERQLGRLGITARAPNGFDITEHGIWLDEVVDPQLQQVIQRVGSMGGGAPKSELKRRRSAARLLASIRQMMSPDIFDLGWLVERDTTAGKISYKPLHVRPFAHRLLDAGERVVFMSASLINPEVVAEALNLPWEECTFLQSDRAYPPENRPVRTDFHVGKVTRKTEDESWPLLVSAIDEILEYHFDDKGIIQCPSGRMLEYFQQRISEEHRPRLLFATSDTKDAMLRRHSEATEPTVLVTYSMWEGVDLAGDLSRFQIIPKMPLATWSGQVKARVEQDGNAGRKWYDWLAITKLLQGCGRSIRSDDDFAITYILDSMFFRYERRMPEWFAAAVDMDREEEETPDEAA
jgi:ATP-dependent DNA helicase DinG